MTIISLVIGACIAFLAFNGLVALFYPYLPKRRKQMRQIFVVERADRQAFQITLNGNTVRVLGVGFPSPEVAELFQREMGDKDYLIQSLIEGPIAPIFDPTNPPDPKQTN